MTKLICGHYVVTKLEALARYFLSRIVTRNLVINKLKISDDILVTISHIANSINYFFQAIRPPANPVFYKKK